MFKYQHTQAEELETVLFNTNGLFILSDIKIEPKREDEYTNSRAQTQKVHLQNWRLRLMMASATPPTNTKRRKRSRASILSRDWSTSFPVSHPNYNPSQQPGHNRESDLMRKYTI